MNGPILILGMQGAGKSTLGRSMAEATGATHFSAGTLLRLRERGGGRYAREIRQRLDQGEAVGTDISYGLLEEAVRGLGDPSRLLLDGYPRDIAQVPALERVLGRKPSRVLLLNVPRPIAIGRILHRECCEVCDAAFGRDFPPRLARTCDGCGGTLSPRRDDSPAALGKRLDGWSAHSKALITRYEGAGILSEIDASRPAREVLVTAMERIEEPVRN